LVEGATDVLIVAALMKNLGVYEKVELINCDGVTGVRQKISKIPATDLSKYIALIDSDLISVSDGEEYAAARLENPNIAVYCAVPEIESWIFADTELVQKWARSANALKMLERLPLPESIPYPRELMRRLLRQDCIEKLHIVLSDLDLNRAASRSPSLRTFIQAVCLKLEVTRDFDIAPLNSSVGRDVFSTLLRELPEGAVVWKTLDGDGLSASDLAKQVQEGTVTGKQYVTEVLRLARDLIGRRSNK
jgi:hypothetical protein